MKKLYLIVLVILIILGILLYFSLNNKSNLSQQISCADMASNFFTSHGFKSSDNNTYTNHFDTKLNKCFIEISSYDPTYNTQSIDLYDALEGKRYASYFGHLLCDSATLIIFNNPKLCQLDSGSIWLDGDDTKIPADYQVGFNGLKNGGIGDENTQKEFLSHIKMFMTE